MPDKTFYRVDIIESEAGWGSRVDESIYFPFRSDAEIYVKNYNEEFNMEPTTPAWYMAAQAPVQEFLTAAEVKKLRADKSGRYHFHKK